MGKVRLAEYGVEMRQGDLIGEIGVFSMTRERTATLVCETDALLLSIADKQVLQLYYQNPKFGVYLVQLIIHRLIQDNHFIAKRKPAAQQDAAPAEAPQAADVEAG
ncbi:MAG: hypothetical protein HY894_03910 [Deltaproteobacteria bacterium]|nr:hypothetical protein [Deltaproteobacteria bacterium]